MKYSDNYGFNLPESSDAADISKLNENFESIDELIAGMLNLAWPVGTLYWSSEPTDPGVLFPGTTWTRIKDKFILAAGDTYEAGTTGGSANAIVVSHSHTVSGTAESAGTHTHVITATSSSAGAHTHTVSGSAASAGAHTHTISGTAESDGAHTHTITVSETSAGVHTHTVSGTTAASGVSGTGKNMPPYEVYYCWERTA